MISVTDCFAIDKVTLNKRYFTNHLYFHYLHASLDITIEAQYIKKTLIVPRNFQNDTSDNCHRDQALCKRLSVIILKQCNILKV